MTLNSLVLPLVIIHVATAIGSLIVGLQAMRNYDTMAEHRKVGLRYAKMMGVSMVTASLLLFFRFNFFLMMVTLLSTQTLITGYRSSKRKLSKKVSTFDWSVTAIAAILPAAYIVWSILMIAGVLPRVLPTAYIYVGIGFAVFIGQGAVEEFRFYRQKHTDRRAWIYFHYQRMLGSYIALVTAFSITVSAFTPLPDQYSWLMWVAPGVVGGWLIGRFDKTYKARFTKKIRTQVAAGD